MKDDKHSEREVVDILGGKLKKDSKKSITSMIMVLVFAFALISPFASSLVAKIYVKEKSTGETISTTITKETTEKTVASTTVVKTTKPTVTTAVKMTTSPTTTAVEKTTKPSITTEESTVIPTRQTETTTKSVPTTCRVTVEKPTTKNVTTEDVIPEVKVTPINNGNYITMLVETYPDGGELSLVCSSSRNAVRVEGNTIIPQNEGGALIAVYYTYNGWRVGDTLCVTVGIKWGETYKTERQEETNSLKVLVSQKEEYQLYRWVCDSCRFRDCYTETKTTCCKDSYPQGTCNGKFTILETKWFSNINPNELQSHSFSGIKSVLGSDSKEWYWTESSHNAKRTLYEYKSGQFCFESIT